jgi:hypothetical protein
LTFGPPRAVYALCCIAKNKIAQYIVNVKTKIIWREKKMAKNRARKVRGKGLITRRKKKKGGGHPGSFSESGKLNSGPLTLKKPRILNG